MTHLAAMEGAATNTENWYLTYDAKTRGDATVGCDRLRERCLDLFAKFERIHGLPQGWGQRFQLGGYR